MQKHAKTGSLEGTVSVTKPNLAVNQIVWRIRITKRNLDLVPKSCKNTPKQVLWMMRVPKLNLDLVSKSRKNTQKQVVWRIWVLKVRFPKLILYRVLKAFVDICLIFFCLF